VYNDNVNVGPRAEGTPVPCLLSEDKVLSQIHRSRYIHVCSQRTETQENTPDHRAAAFARPGKQSLSPSKPQHLPISQVHKTTSDCVFLGITSLSLSKTLMRANLCFVCQYYHRKPAFDAALATPTGMSQPHRTSQADPLNTS
jgi:hypothetical protein